jgi:vacuolar protein sorting-associated protein 16
LERIARNLDQQKDKGFEKSIVDEQLVLLTTQKALEANLGGESFIGKSLSDTLYQLIILNQHKQVQKLRTTFKIPDKRYWWITCRALAAKGDWKGLLAFSKEKKSPIGFGVSCWLSFIFSEIQFLKCFCPW